MFSLSKCLWWVTGSGEGFLFCLVLYTQCLIQSLAQNRYSVSIWWTNAWVAASYWLATDFFLRDNKYIKRNLIGSLITLIKIFLSSYLFRGEKNPTSNTDCQAWHDPAWFLGHFRVLFCLMSFAYAVPSAWNTFPPLSVPGQLRIFIYFLAQTSCLFIYSRPWEYKPEQERCSPCPLGAPFSGRNPLSPPPHEAGHLCFMLS